MAKKKTSISVKTKRGQIQIIRTIYDDLGKVLKKQVEVLEKSNILSGSNDKNKKRF